MSAEIQITTLSKELPLAEFRRRFVDIPRFRAACEACPAYSGTWACPPFDADPEAIWSGYESILLYAKKVVIPAEAREKTYSKAELRDLWDSMLKPVKRDLITELLALEREIPGSLALSAGGCDICESCTRPQGIPCRAPELKRYSVEAIGGDAIGAVEELLGESILWAGEGRLPEHFILLGALLKG